MCDNYALCLLLIDLQLRCYRNCKLINNKCTALYDVNICDPKNH